jgi:hypothetical protein
MYLKVGLDTLDSEVTKKVLDSSYAIRIGAEDFRPPHGKGDGSTDRLFYVMGLFGFAIYA